MKIKGDANMSDLKGGKFTIRLARFGALAVFALAAGAVYSQAVEPTNSLPNPYAGAPFGKLPEGRNWGSTAGIGVDRDGKSIWVAERCGAFAPPSQVRPGVQMGCDGSNLDPILKFDETGKLVKSFGAGLILFPHGLSVDPEGNVWVTDGLGKEGKGHQVGKFIKTWGKKGSAPGEIDGPHTLAMDSRGRLFLGDRGNNRIQIFDQDGNFIDQWAQFSRPSGVYIDKNDVIYVADSESGSVNKTRTDWKRGIRVGSAKDGKVTAFIPDPDENATTTSAAEGVTADAQGNIYGAEVGPKRVMKYVSK